MFGGDHLISLKSDITNLVAYTFFDFKVQIHGRSVRRKTWIDDYLGVKEAYAAIKLLKGFNILRQSFRTIKTAKETQQGFLGGQVLFQISGVPELVAFKCAMLNAYFGAFIDSENHLPVTRIPTFFQDDFNKVIALFLVLLLNTIYGITVGDVIEWTALFQAGPCCQHFCLDAPVTIESHLLHDGAFVNCED